MNARLHDTEPERLAALYSFNVLDSPPEPDFNELALTASRICEAPIALISLVDADRQWFKARVGLDAAQTPRDQAFCAHAILEPDLLIVPDTLRDERFADNPLVTGAPHIRFYAGAPLRTAEGHALGTLCVIDRVPRTLTLIQVDALRALSRQVVAQLELRKITAALDRTMAETRAAMEALRASEEFKTRMIECSRDCIKVLDLDGNLLSMNAGGMEALEICDLGPFLHTSWIDFWQSEDRARARDAVTAARDGGVGRFVGYFETNQTHTPMWFDVVVNAILDAAGKPDRLLALSRDVTQLKQAEAILRSAHDELERKVRERTAELAEVNTSLRREVIDRKEAEATLRAIVEGVESETGDRFFASLVRHLAAALKVQYAFVSEISADKQRFRTCAVWGRGALMENFEVPLAGTPCESVLRGEMAHYSDGLQQRFPEDSGLVDWGVQSYCGVPLCDDGDRVLGHLAILDDRPIVNGARALGIMRIFATRARAEMERLGSEAAVRASEARLGAIIESALDAFIVVDDAGVVCLFNPAAEKVFRCQAAEVLGTRVERFMMPASAASFRQAWEDIRTGTKLFSISEPGLTARRADGEEFEFEGTLSRALVGGHGMWTITIRDLAERRRLEHEQTQLRLQSAYLQEEIKAVHNFEEIVGSSGALARVLDQVQLVANTDSTVLLLGETGTGKELIARAIHSNSPRKDRPLIKVNCAALPTGLIESELFGHEKGAFTGASDRRIGRFELAHGGTLFLDEVGEMPLDLQVKLLRVLQEHEFERIGGRDTIRVDVRLITATNRDLARAVADGAFRADLYYRLNVFPVALPPLRDRRTDIPLLVHYFVARYAAKIGKRIERVPDATMQRLLAYPWPGNVRELENVIERAVILSAGCELNLPPDLAMAGPSAASPPASRAAETIDARVAGRPNGGDLQTVERDHIVAVLKQSNWRIEGEAGAAAILKLNPSTLRSRMKKLGIRRSHDSFS